MIAFWLLYVVVVGVLAALVAAALEHVLRLWRRPVRFVWAAALFATVAAPLVVRFAPGEPVSEVPAPAAVMPAGEAVALSTMPVVPSWPDRIAASLAGLGARLEPAARRLAPLDRPLVALWALLSATLLVSLLRSARRLRRRRGEWTPAVVDGVPVLVAADLGPAVVGGRDARVVLPSWAMQLDAPLRQLVLRHEHEHLRAGDPHLLLAGLAAVIAMPWNPALWWQLGRLRLAVELDCDRRVLQAHGDVERYGLLLMAVSQRAGGLMRLAMPALSESSAALERRIAAMTAATPRRRGARAAALGAVDVAAAGVACIVPSPNRLSAATLESSAPRAQRATLPDTIPVKHDTSDTYFEYQVEEPVVAINRVSPAYPAALRSQRLTGQVIAQFVVDVDGSVQPGSFRVLESNHELFTAAVEAVVPEMRFEPAKVGGQPVRQLVQQPFVFSAGASPSAAAGTAMPASTMPSRAPAASGSVRGGGVLRPSKRPPTLSDPNQTYFEYQVEQPARVSNDAHPVYPAALKAQHVAGQVIAQYEVDTEGQVDMSTFKVVESSHPLFTDAVREAVSRLRFQPAEIGGKQVRQLVQQAFAFKER